MDAFSLLETTAEISVAFAGFSSLFMVLAMRGESLAAEIAALIRLILIGSLASLFLAVVPLIASGLGLVGPPLWRAAATLGLANCVGMSMFAASQRRSLSEREVTVFIRVAWALAVLSALAYVSNLAGWPFLPNGSLHLGGIWFGLAIASVNLADLVFRFALRAPSA